MVFKAIAGLVVTVVAAGGGTGIAYKVSIKHIGDVIREKNLVLVAKKDTGWEKIWEAFKKNNNLKDQDFKDLKEAANKSDTQKTKENLYEACESTLTYPYSNIFLSPSETNNNIISDFESVCVSKISGIHTFPTTIKNDLLKGYESGENKPALTDELEKIKTKLANDSEKTNAESELKNWCDARKEEWYLGDKDTTFLLVSNICKDS